MRTLTSGIIAISLLIGARGWASGEKPAVSEPNALIHAAFVAGGSDSDSAQALLFGGQVSVPLDVSWGARANLSVGPAFQGGSSAKEAAAGGLAAFWRRPESGFVQIGGFGSHFGSFNTYGAELSGGRFLKAQDIELGVAYLGGDADSAMIGRVAYGVFQTDDIRLGASLIGGATFSQAARYGVGLNVSWQPRIARNVVLSFDAEGGGVESEAIYHVGVAAVFYFGETRTLRQKIREDW